MSEILQVLYMDLVCGGRIHHVLQHASVLAAYWGQLLSFSASGVLRLPQPDVRSAGLCRRHATGDALSSVAIPSRSTTGRGREVDKGVLVVCTGSTYSRTMHVRWVMVGDWVVEQASLYKGK